VLGNRRNNKIINELYFAGIAFFMWISKGFIGIAAISMINYDQMS